MGHSVYMQLWGCDLGNRETEARGCGCAHWPTCGLRAVWQWQMLTCVNLAHVKFVYEINWQNYSGNQYICTWNEFFRFSSKDKFGWAAATKVAIYYGNMANSDDYCEIWRVCNLRWRKLATNILLNCESKMVEFLVNVSSSKFLVNITEYYLMSLMEVWADPYLRSKFQQMLIILPFDSNMV